MIINAGVKLAASYPAAGRAASLAVATLLLNTVPTVCKADVGLINNLTLASYAGGYFAEEPTREGVGIGSAAT